MEPEIRYCTTADGVRIAYTVTGTGTPHVFVNDPVGSHVQLEWRHRVMGPLLTELSRHNTVVRLDLRGCGLSDRVLPAAPIDWARDIEAVVARLGLDTFALTGAVTGSLPAITLAAQYGDRISRLVLENGRARPAEESSQIRALIALADVDFTMATELVGAIAYGTGRDESRDEGAYARTCIGPEYLRFIKDISEWDLGPVCGRISAPTLVIRHKGLEFNTDEMARDLVARIPDCRLQLAEGRIGDDLLGLARCIASFINGGEVEGDGDVVPLPSATAIILFADLVDSAARTEQLGDAAFREQHRRLDDRLRALIQEHGGSAVAGRTLGDGVLASFASARDAIAAGRALTGVAAEFEMPLHIGIHAGDVLRQDENMWGGAVNIAARISGLSSPNEILISATVRDLARTSAGVMFEDRGEQTLRGIVDPLRLFAVHAV